MNIPKDQEHYDDDQDQGWDHDDEAYADVAALLKEQGLNRAGR